jgi:cyclin-C
MFQNLQLPPSLHMIPVIAMLGKRLTLRQRVIASATVFFRRFYVKNLYCETDPFIVIAACCYVAAKAEESPVHIKNVVSESRLMFGRACEPPPFSHYHSLFVCRGGLRR